MHAWSGTWHTRTPKCWFPSHLPISQGREKPNQHAVVTGVGTDHCLPKKGQSQSIGRTPPSWQGAGAEPGRLESFQSQREGYCQQRERSEQTQGSREHLASCAGGAAETGCGIWLLLHGTDHMASDFYFRGTGRHSTQSGRLSLLPVRHPPSPPIGTLSFLLENLHRTVLVAEITGVAGFCPGATLSC